MVINDIFSAPVFPHIVSVPHQLTVHERQASQMVGHQTIGREAHEVEETI